MASRSRELQKKQIEQEKKQKLLTTTFKKTRFWHILSLGLCVVTLLLFFVTFVEIYNVKFGVEAKVNGWGFFLAAITGNYSSPDSRYQDLSMPFYYYAKSWCNTVGTLMIVAVIIIGVIMVLEGIVVIKNKHVLTFVSTFLSLCCTVIIFAAFLVALDMKNAQILSVFCVGNPDCSIRSSAIWPSIFMALCTALDGVISVKLFKAYKQSK